MQTYDDERILAELHRAWESTWELGTQRSRQDWATFRAITLRETRRRGLTPDRKTLYLILKRGARL